MGNYATWKQGGGIPGDGTSPLAASPDFLLCLSSVLRPPYGVYGILICIGLLAVLLIMVMRMGYGDAGEYDEDRNFSYSAKGTYGTSGWMSRKEMSGVLDLVPDLRKHKGVVLGMLDGKAVCIPEDTRINSNLAVYGASGSMKTRSFCMNRILQATVRGENSAGESLIICDPKSELYEKSSEFLRSRGYCVKVFNLVSPENSDSWCCLAEVEGQELMAQLFVDVIIKNTTNNGKSDHFWDACEMNLLKALVLYVDQGYAEENRNIGEVYRLLTLNGESQLDTLFEALPSTHPAKAPYSLFKQASDTVRSGVIIGLGSRLQVFQSELIKKITAKNEIDLELPGQQPCAYFLVTSDQDSTFDFLASLFLSFCFIKLVRYADHNCEGGKLPVPVHILGEELTCLLYTSETAIIENANEITFTLNGILGEALDDVLARIEADFAASGADHMEVKNAYSGGPIYNANLFISQYCAAKDKDFESISLNDLAATLRENKQHLYSYTSKQEIRESTVTDPETGEETTEPETWMVYTVRYNGESYFSDVVFQLTDDQKELAADYASNLSLFLGDGLLQNLEAWTGNSITSLGDVTFTDGITPVVYYNQLDERYAGKAYGTDNIGGYGCGPTAMAIVVSSLTDDMVDPMEMAEWSYNNGYWCKSSGSYHALIPAAAGEWGLPVSGCTTAEPQRITDALANGKLVVAIMSEGHFTSSGHFIVLRGVKDGKIMVADPASYTRSEQLWDLSIILNEASRRAGAGGPFWIIG